MRKIILAMAVFLAATIGYGAVKFTAQEMVPKSKNTPEVKSLVGTMVRNFHGEVLGMITDIVPGPEGRVVFAVLSYWVSDDTQRRVAVPFDALSCEEGNCVLSAGRDTLDSVPAFVLEDDLAEPRLAEDIYRYYGIRPYWTEEGIER